MTSSKGTTSQQVKEKRGNGFYHFSIARSSAKRSCSFQISLSIRRRVKQCSNLCQRGRTHFQLKQEVLVWNCFFRISFEKLTYMIWGPFSEFTLSYLFFPSVLSFLPLFVLFRDTSSALKKAQTSGWYSDNVIRRVSRLFIRSTLSTFSFRLAAALCKDPWLCPNCRIPISVYRFLIEYQYLWSLDPKNK